MWRIQVLVYLPPLFNKWAMTIVWRISGKTVLVPHLTQIKSFSKCSSLGMALKKIIQNKTTQGGHTFTLKSLMSLSTKKKITSAPRCFLFYQVSSHFWRKKLYKFYDNSGFLMNNRSSDFLQIRKKHKIKNKHRRKVRHLSGISKK